MPLYRRKTETSRFVRITGAMWDHNEPLPEGVRYSNFIGLFIEDCRGIRIQLMPGDWIRYRQEDGKPVRVRDEIKERNWELVEGQP